MPRGFEIVTPYLEKNVNLPKRKTGLSAGYDIEAAETTSIPSGEIGRIPTGLKAFMMSDEALLIYPRSSLFQTRHCIFVNSVAIIDADYYNNPGNEGHIVLTLYNVSNDAITIAKGERFAQGVFQKYLKTDDDVQTDVKRTGGYGSTGL